MSHDFEMSEEIIRRIKSSGVSYYSTEKLVRDFNTSYANHKMDDDHLHGSNE